MSAECARRGELAKFMTHHILCNVNGYKLIAVVHCESVVTKSGEIIDARLQVLMTDFLPLSSMAATFFSSFTLINGPFLSERLIIVFF